MLTTWKMGGYGPFRISLAVSKFGSCIRRCRQSRVARRSKLPLRRDSCLTLIGPTIVSSTTIWSAWREISRLGRGCFQRRSTSFIVPADELCFAALLVVFAPTFVWAVDGEDLAFRSNGFDSGTEWQLNNNGYVGTYINLDTPGDVTISVAASGDSSGGVAPHMNLVVADTVVPFDINPTATDTYQHTFALPSGTYFVRAEFTNDPERSARSLRIADLNVTGAKMLNSATNANALAAANTYIEHYRKGDATLDIAGVEAGTPVHVKLVRHAFNFGTAVGGINTYLGNATPGSTAEKFQQALAETRINALVPENVGKWSNNEILPSFQTMMQVDQFLNFAEQNNMRARMHNLIWDHQQPNWVNALIDQAAAGSETALNTLRTEISERIEYYVGDGDSDLDDGDRSQQYIELDVLNESVHAGNYQALFGVEGIAGIYKEVADAVFAAGATTTLATNEFNVLQDDYRDFYGNWYREEIERLNNTAFGQVVTSIGVQSYENNQIGTGGGSHNPSRKMQTLQNLSVLDMPIVLTEFGVKDPTSEVDAAQMMEETMRIVFGTANAEGFFMWGIYRGDIFRGASALYREDWTLSPAGERWIDLMTIDEDTDLNDDWDTDLIALVGDGGAINFKGFFGDYEITIGDRNFDLTLVKGTDQYSIGVPEPSSAALVGLSTFGLLVRRRRRERLRVNKHPI